MATGYASQQELLDALNAKGSGLTDEAKAKLVRDEFLSYKKKLDTTLDIIESYGDTVDTDIKVIKRKITYLLLMIDKLNTNNRLSSEELLNVKATMRLVGEAIAKRTDLTPMQVREKNPIPEEKVKSEGRSKPSTPANNPPETKKVQGHEQAVSEKSKPTLTEQLRLRRKELIDSEKEQDARFDKLSKRLGENVDTVINKSASLVSTGSSGVIKTALANLLGPGAPLVMILDDFVNIEKRAKSVYTGVTGFARNAVKGMAGKVSALFRGESAKPIGTLSQEEHEKQKVERVRDKKELSIWSAIERNTKNSVTGIKGLGKSLGGFATSVISGIGSILGSIFGKASSLLGKPLGLIKGLGSGLGGIAASRFTLPVAGAAFGGYGLYDAFTQLKDNKGMSSQERTKQYTKSALSGTLTGASIGTLIAPGIGTAVGAALGGVLGTLSAAIADNSDKLKQFGEDIKTWFRDFQKYLGDKITQAFTWGKEAKDKIVAQGNLIKEEVVTAYNTAKNNAISQGSLLKDSAVSTYEGAKNWVLGQTTKVFESGKEGAATVSTGKGDAGGASYGTYQLSSKKGTLANFLKQTQYGSYFQGLTPGTPEFNAKWKGIAASDPNFGTVQHDFIKRTHYDPQVALLAKRGIDLSKRGNAVQDAIWSTSVQHGGATDVIAKALSGKNLSQLSDADVINSIQTYKAANNEKRFASSSKAVRDGVFNRIEKERQALLKVSAATSANALLPQGTKSDQKQSAGKEYVAEVVKPIPAYRGDTLSKEAPSSQSKTAVTPQATPASQANVSSIPFMPEDVQLLFANLVQLGI